MIFFNKNDKVRSDIQRYIRYKIQLLQSSFMGDLKPDLFNNIVRPLAEKADSKYIVSVKVKIDFLIES